MAVVTLKSLHNYLKLLENASELKRKMPASTAQRTMKEALCEMSKLVGLDQAAFKDPQIIAALIGPQRFVMFGGEPSVTDHVARIFDSSSALLTVLINPAHFEKSPSGQLGAAPNAAYQQPQSTLEKEPSLDSLQPLLAGNVTLTCRLFRSIFEHMLGFVSPSSAQQANVLLVNELTGSKTHSRSFLSTALFLLGTEVDHDHLMSFMLEQSLFGVPIFEHMLQHRDYYDAYYTFRRLERAFIGPLAEEETQLRNRMDKFNAEFGGTPCGVKIFGADQDGKAWVDAHFAAADLLDALALTPWAVSLSRAVSVDSAKCVNSLKTVAGHFERCAVGTESQEQANREIADHLLAFARQFSADSRPV